jgi:hypothetical protein
MNGAGSDSSNADDGARTNDTNHACKHCLHGVVLKQDTASQQLRHDAAQAPDVNLIAVRVPQYDLFRNMVYSDAVCLQGMCDERRATSDKRQATSDKRQATSDKRQALS